MQSKDSTSEEKDNTMTASPTREKVSPSPKIVSSNPDEDTIAFSPLKGKAPANSRIVTAASVQAEDVPTIPLGSLQIGANLVNDYYDYIRNVDISNPLGPGDLIQQGLIKPSSVLGLGLIMLAISAIIGIVLAFTGGLLALLFGIFGLFCAFFY